MPTRKQMDRMAAAVGRKAPPVPGLAPDDDLPPEYWRASRGPARGRSAPRPRRQRHPDAATCRRRAAPAASRLFALRLDLREPEGGRRPFGDKAGLAAALFGFGQMAGAACGAFCAAVLSADPVLGLAIVLAVTAALAMILHRRDGQLSAKVANSSLPARA